MIETEQQVTIAAPINAVWDFVSDIERWAALMPGMQACEVIDPDHSRWVLKVGVGGLVRTVKVNVAVASWDGPGAVDFSYALEGDPVRGGGTYRALATSPDATAVILQVQVVGSGPLAPMWEAMGRPLLPQLANAFAERLRDRIELEAGTALLAPPRIGLLTHIWVAILRIFR